MNILTYTGVGVALNLILVVFRRQDLFYWLIVNILHKRPDLTFRIQIWDAALKEIQEHLMIGQGYHTFVLPGTGETTHNQYMEMLYKTGIIGLVIFLILLAVVIFILFKNRKIREAKWISLFLGGFFIMFVMESAYDEPPNSVITSGLKQLLAKVLLPCMSSTNWRVPPPSS